jgi:hypothetical protein
LARSGSQRLDEALEEADRTAIPHEYSLAPVHLHGMLDPEVSCVSMNLAELERHFEANRNVYRARDGKGRDRTRSDQPHSNRKLCFVATDKDFLVRLLYDLSLRDDCYFVKYSADARDGMYLGRAFFLDDTTAGGLWAEYKKHPKLMCSLQDDDITDGFRRS